MTDTERKRLWRARNPQHVQANTDYNRAWRAKNRERVSATKRRWRKLNPEKRKRNEPVFLSLDAHPGWEQCLPAQPSPLEILMEREAA